MIKVSVAMTTYNGEKHLNEQLISLINQEKKPDEVIICDDGSTDNTVAIIKKFMEDNNLKSSWKVYKNKINKGYTRNFLDCASMTTGDIIFFCDQDDIWHPDKISKMTTTFKDNNIKAMSCTLSVIDSQGKTINTLFNKLRLGDGKLKKINFSAQVKNNMSVGLTLAVRRETIDYLKPIILKYDLPFDVPVGLLTSIDGGYYILGIPLVYRRVHSNNVSDPKYTLKSRLLNVGKHIEGRFNRIKLMRTCLYEMQDLIQEKDKKNLVEAINSLEQSVINLQKRNIYPLILDIFNTNPMINRLIAITNLLCALFGDYSNVNFDNED